MIRALACLVLLALIPVEAAAQTIPDAIDCFGPVEELDPETDAAAWVERDLQNVACGYQRQYDELANPAFLRRWAEEAGIALGQIPRVALEQSAEPTRPRTNPVYWVPLSKVTDPFRIPDDWEAAGRGQVQRFAFIASSGAKLIARIYSPNAKRDDHLPGIVFMPGFYSYNDTNSWFAQGMAEAGYIVLILDPQGQGDSEQLAHRSDGTVDCSSNCGFDPLGNHVPNFESAIDFFLSTPGRPYRHATGENAAGTLRHNPLWARLDRARLGIAGHSLGALSGVPTGQIDPRVKAIAAYDNLDASLEGEALRKVHAPTLLFGADYDFPQPPLPKIPANPPNRLQHLPMFRQLRSAGVDAMVVTPRAASHQDWSYQPMPATLPASRYGERTSFYYSRAWFDRYLKGDRGATARLTGLRFDGSADESSIGAGTFDSELALARPADPGAGNVPYEIEGRCVSHLLSFYFDSAYWLDGGRFATPNMRARGCSKRP